MPEKPTYEELEQRIRELEGREHYRNNKESQIFSQLEKHGAILLIIDPDSGDIRNANIAAQNYYGYSIKTLEKMKIQDINMLSPDEVAERRRQAADETLNWYTAFPAGKFVQLKSSLRQSHYKAKIFFYRSFMTSPIVRRQRKKGLN